MPKLIASMTFGYAGLLPWGAYINLTSSRVASKSISGDALEEITNLRDLMSTEMKALQISAALKEHRLSASEVVVIEDLLHVISFSTQILQGGETDA
jgi:hypothetical protein